MNKKRIILCGCAASGKDYARKIIETNTDAKYQTSYTSRPPRAGEVNGKDYHFMDQEEFAMLIDENFWYEFVTFNGCYYGTSKEQLKNGKLFIMTQHGISLVTPEDRKESIVVYFDIDEVIRRERLITRKDKDDTIERRLKADHNDFNDFKDFDIRITEAEFTANWILKVIHTYGKKIFNHCTINMHEN